MSEEHERTEDDLPPHLMNRLALGGVHVKVYVAGAWVRSPWGLGEVHAETYVHAECTTGVLAWQFGPVRMSLENGVKQALRAQTGVPIEAIEGSWEDVVLLSGEDNDSDRD